MRLKIREQDVVNSILDYLRMRRISHVHVRNTGAIVQRDGKTRFFKPRNSQLGAPDIIFCFGGRAVACEVKSPTGKLSTDQFDWLKSWQSEPSSGVSVVARSVEDVEKLLGEICSLKNSASLRS